jgi:hypothetical protein
MEIEDAALNNTEYARAYWVIDCVFCGVVFLERMLDFWKSVHTAPSDLLGWVPHCLAILYVFFPLLAAYQFRRLLKRESQRELLSARMFAICDWRIAQLLFLAYMGLLIFNMRT